MNRQRNVAVGVFEERHQAQSAVGDLRRAGFREDEIGVIARNGESIGPSDAGEEAVAHSKMIEGAAAGMATGAGVGAIWALGVAAGMLPAIGPVVAGGILASLAASAAGAAAIGTLVGSLVGLGIPEDEAEEYHTHFVEGRTIVTVKADHRYPEAVQILEAHGGHVSFPYTVTDKTVDDVEAGVVTRGTRPAGLDPIRASDQQTLAEPMESRAGEEASSAEASRSVRMGRSSTGQIGNPGEGASMPPRTTPASMDRAAELPGNFDRLSPDAEQTDESSRTAAQPLRRMAETRGNEFDRPT